MYVCFCGFSQSLLTLQMPSKAHIHLKYLCMEWILYFIRNANKFIDFHPCSQPNEQPIEKIKWMKAKRKKTAVPKLYVPNMLDVIAYERYNAFILPFYVNYYLTFVLYGPWFICLFFFKRVGIACIQMKKAPKKRIK